MNITKAIKIALPTFVKYREEGEETIRKALIKAGIPEELSCQLVEFLPIAFGRVFLKNMPVDLSDEYIRYVFADGEFVEKERKKLSSHPVFTEAKNIALSMAKKNRWALFKSSKGEQFETIAKWSAEVKAISYLMIEKGSKPENIVLTPPSLQWRE